MLLLFCVGIFGFAPSRSVNRLILDGVLRFAPCPFSIGVSALRAEYYFIIVNSRTVPWFADFVSSPLPSLFSRLVAAFITARISGGSPFRYVCQSRLWFLGAYLPFSLSQFVSLVLLLPFV
ncbi:hypothetical protein DY000_02041633 [Brassica cretica]|uniref:ABC-2 type transporter domain-containing protein n=1 Tax=Brassica cretica TaxID=69181 RepID=A0ABQ7BL34_BRACR|nr:hypothetical protein DY000_02041633 [Brassica cretica]